jgi:hypothetical protein
MSATALLASYHREHGGTTKEVAQQGHAYGEVRRHKNGTYSYFVAIDGTIKHVSYDFETFDGARGACLNAVQTWRNG